MSYSAIITGTGSHLPEKRLTNDDLAKIVETNDDWITQRTGIKERRVATKDDTTASLASHAATKALHAAGLEPKDIDLILCATITPEMVTPSTACFVAASLGLSKTPAMDLSAACSGFVYALETAAAFIKSGRYKNVLIVCAETLSRITDYQDRGSCILFGDGAGAVVVSRGEDPERGLLHSTLHADGSGWELLYCQPGSKHPIDEVMVAGRQQYLKLRGREVFKFAVSRFQELVEDAAKKTGLTKDDITLVIPHQSNMRIIEASMQKLGLPLERAVINIDKYGNTSAASIPIALDEAVRGGRLKKGDVVVFVAIGAGLTWANAVVRM
ncbi:MAG: beta-ketoacyl-ACP synthase III [Tepidisphaeraceae bacterium]